METEVSRGFCLHSARIFPFVFISFFSVFRFVFLFCINIASFVFVSDFVYFGGRACALAVNYL